MKRTFKNRFATALAVLSAATALTGCGKSDPNGVPPGGALPPGGLPGAGGCIPLVTAYGAYGAPQGTQQGMLSFNGTNIYWDGRKITAGQVPYSQNQGGFLQVAPGQGVGGGPYNRSGVDGTLSMNITQTPAPGGYQQPYYGGTNTGATTANVTGYVQISQPALDELLRLNGGGYGSYYPYQQPGYLPQPGMPAQQPATCVSGIAIDGLWAPNAGFYNTWVYLYLNNTQHGYKLYF